MDRRGLLWRFGSIPLIGAVAGCTSGSTGETTDAGDASTPTSTFDGNWGLPPCRTNEDARVVVRSYDPEQGVGQVYNRTTTNLYVSLMNDAGSTAEDNQGRHDIYVPFGESEPFRLGGPLRSVVTMTEREYRRRDSVDWLYRHETQDSEACTLPPGEAPSSVELTPNERAREEERIKDRVRDAAESESTEMEGTPTENADRSTPTQEPSGELLATVLAASKATSGVRVRFSVEAGPNAPSSASYVVRVLTRGEESYSVSGTLSLERGGIVSTEVSVEFDEFDVDEEYAVELILDGTVQDLVVLD